MTTRWTHAICDACYTKRHPGREPMGRLNYPARELCCFCRAITTSGIYVNDFKAENEVRCQGRH